MAESITYADLRFVKAPLKNATCQLGQGTGGMSSSSQDHLPTSTLFHKPWLLPADEDEDGDITYENVQVCPAPGAIASLASSAPVDKAGAGLSSEQQPPLWPSSKPPAARRILRGPVTCMQYVLLGLLLVSLLLGVAAICLGVRYLQVFRQLQTVHRALESTNSSLGQRLSLAQARLQQREEELQASREQLDQKEESLSRKEQEGLNTQKQLEDCKREREETKASLQREQTQRESLDERLRNIREKLKQLYTCRGPGERIVETMEDFCCPVGWILKESTCFHISLTKRSWQESQDYCRSLSSDLASSDYSIYLNENRGLKSLLRQLNWAGSYWIQYGKRNKGIKNGYYEKPCIKMDSYRPGPIIYFSCEDSLPCICELEAVRHPDMDHLLH